MGQTSSLEGLLFLLFDLVLFCLATFFLVSSVLYFTYYFSLNFLPPAFSFDLQCLMKLLVTFSFLQILSLSIFSTPPSLFCFFPLHYFYTTSHLFFCVSSFIHPFLCSAVPVNLPVCSWRQAIDLPSQTPWRSSETGAGGESPCQYFLKEGAREDLSPQYRHACFPFSRECTILSYSGLSH